METNSVANRILCSERSHQFLRFQVPTMRTKRRGKIQVKGKGAMTVYWVADDLLTPRSGMKDKNVYFDLPTELESTHAQDDMLPEPTVTMIPPLSEVVDDKPTTKYDLDMVEQAKSELFDGSESHTSIDALT